MKKPLLILVTGRPGAGKTTLAGQMGQAWHLPVISRDGIKEGLVHTLGQGHDALPAGTAGFTRQDNCSPYKTNFTAPARMGKQR